MALISAAYFDASGQQEGYSCLTVAGATAPAKKWIRFEKEWNKVLADEHVTEFHATDFACSMGEYKEWKDDKARRSAFVGRLIDTIKANVNKLFAVTVEKSAWDTVNKEYLVEETFHSLYAIAGFSVASQARHWAKKKKLRPDTFKIFFEGGDVGWDGLKELCQRYCNFEPIRLPKKEGIPFQIGDFLAWKIRVAATNIIEKPRDAQTYDKLEENKYVQRELKSLDRILVRPISNGIYSDRALRRTCVNFKVRKR